MYKLIPILLFVVFGLSNEQPTDERILEYKTDIAVSLDGVLEITERITVSTQGIKIRRGIFRYFPTHYKDKNGNQYRVLLQVDEVLKDSSPTTYSVEKVTNGKRIKIGEKDVLLQPDIYTYTIKYLTNNQIGFFQDFDELYFNAIGNGWAFPIDKAKVTLRLPKGVKIIKSIAYTGKKGEKESNYNVKIMDNKVRFENLRPFAPDEGLTIAVSWTKGFIMGSENYRIDKSHNNQLSLNRDDIYDDSWAVIIGIDKYKYSDQLNYAVKDAEAVKDMLISKFDFPEENIRYLMNEEATLTNIKLNLGEVATSADENDRILVFYSGHGETMQGADGSERGYIIPFEGRQDKPYATGFAMDEILTTSQLSKSKHMLFLMDACYSGLMTENRKGLAKPKGDRTLLKLANQKARQIITAGGSGEQVIERDEWQHSAFTKNLLASLDDWEADGNGDGYVTADELGTHLRTSVTEDSDLLQTPQKGRFRNSGGGEFVFFSDATVTIPSSDTDEEDEILYGCMDEGANNFNPNATKPDRSCQYGQLVTSLEFGELIKINKIIGTDINIPDGKTGENYVDGYFIVYEIPVIINNNIEIAGFQFDIDGGNIIQASGGIAEEYGFMTSHSESTVLSYSVNGDVFPRSGNQVLLDLQIEPIWYTSIIGTTGVVTTKYKEVCIQEIILADKDGQQIESNSFDCFKPVFPTR